jgi:two-component system CheB/CheR fusion protein
VPNGQVSLTWRQFDGEDAPELELTWQERGGPLVTEPTKSGFGTNVMKFSIERGLGGQISTSFAAAGIRHDVRFPRVDETDHPDENDPLAPEE